MRTGRADGPVPSVAAAPATATQGQHSVSNPGSPTAIAPTRTVTASRQARPTIMEVHAQGDSHRTRTCRAAYHVVARGKSGTALVPAAAPRSTYRTAPSFQPVRRRRRKPPEVIAPSPARSGSRTRASQGWVLLASWMTCAHAGSCIRNKEKRRMAIRCVLRGTLASGCGKKSLSTHYERICAIKPHSICTRATSYLLHAETCL